MKTSKLFTSVLVLSSLAAVACGSSSFSGDDSISPNDNDVSGNGNAAAPDASVPANCDVTKTPAQDGCVVNETLGIFVAPPQFSDAGTEDGTRAHPFSKMQTAVDTANSQKKRVYACVGNYAEQVTLADGVSIFGDLDCAQGWSVTSKHAVIQSPASPAVRVNQITSATRVDSVDMIAPDATIAGGSSIALIVNESPALVVANATIKSGKAMKGADGAAGVQLSNSSTANGSSNAASLLGDCSGINGTTCVFHHLGNANGGSNNCVGGKAVSGGTGGGGGNGIGDAVVTSTATFIEFGNQYYMAPGILATNGYPFAATATTAAGGTKSDLRALSPGGNPAQGQNGADGASGTNGTSATVPGVISVNGFVPSDGTAGTDGYPGQGGGGGAGYDFVTETTTSFPYGDAIYFTNGAGGGAGGCPGLAGGAGSGGGASIAVIAVASPVTFDTCIIQASNGGDGGQGSLGSAAVAGGVGGLDVDPGACTTTICTLGQYEPHSGGSGGAGGQSGWSGSGAGGPSIGVASHGAAAVLINTVPAAGTVGHGVAAITAGSKTIPASADGVAAATQTF